jgi:hypothetical protein
MMKYEKVLVCSLSFLGCLLILLLGIYNPMFPRRYNDHSAWIIFTSFYEMGQELRWTVLAVAAAQALFIFNLVYSAMRGKKSSN